MLELWVLRLVDKDNPEDNSSAEQISLRPEFKWFLTEEFRRLRYGDGKDNQVVSSKLDEGTERKITP